MASTQNHPVRSFLKRAAASVGLVVAVGGLGAAAGGVGGHELAKYDNAKDHSVLLVRGGREAIDTGTGIVGGGVLGESALVFWALGRGRRREQASAPEGETIG